MNRVISRAQQLAALLVLLAFAQPALAMPASPFKFKAVQPDGTPIALHIRGDEHYHWNEDLLGYTVTKDNAGRYVYAVLGKDGNLEATELTVGRDDPVKAGLKLHTIASQAVRDQSTRRASDSPQAIAPFGNVKNLVIMVRFADHSTRPLPTSNDIDVLFNAVGGDAQLAPTGSVRDYYYETSYGQMELNSTVVAWVDLPETEAYYADGTSGGQILWQGLRYALDVVDQTVNFDDFDTDNDGRIDSIAFIHSGYGAEWGGTDQYGAGTANRIWSHRWTIQPNWTSDEGVIVSDYHISPGVWGRTGSAIGRIGVIAHETGHFFGLPDLYDLDGSGSGIGSFGVMGNSWGFNNTQRYPSHFSPWSKISLGWLSPTVISAPGIYQLGQTETNPSVYRINDGYPSNEYLLIENRQRVGFDSVMPQGGLVVWHIDDTAGFNTEGHPGQAGWPGNGNHYRVAVLQADGNYQLEKGGNRGNAGDVYHGGGVSEIGPNTLPNTDAYQNGNILSTGNTLSQISAAAPTMTFTLGPPTIAPSIAVADHQATYGTVTGTYVNTQTQNNGYQTIREVDSGGKLSQRHDRLDHTWRFSLNDAHNRFNIDAYSNIGGDADDAFNFEYSANPNGPWTMMLAVTNAVDDNLYQQHTIESPPSTIYIRVVDNSRGASRSIFDVIHIDHMYFDTSTASQDPPGTAGSPNPANAANGVSTTASLGWNAGTDTQSHNVYFGTSVNPAFIGNQASSTYSPGTLTENTTYYWRIDEVNDSGTTTGSLWSFTTGGGVGTCALVGETCSSDSDCCSNKCRGPGGRRTCR